MERPITLDPGSMEGRIESSRILAHCADVRRETKANSLKRRAHHAVETAIRSGRLVRQAFDCGERGEAHHESYSEPLDVQWRCWRHTTSRRTENGVSELRSRAGLGVTIMPRPTHPVTVRRSAEVWPQSDTTARVLPAGVRVLRAW